jgi:hypothetical protein
VNCFRHTRNHLSRLEKRIVDFKAFQADKRTEAFLASRFRILVTLWVSEILDEMRQSSGGIPAV